MTDNSPQVIYLPSPSKWRTIFTITGVIVGIILILAIGGLLKKLYDDNTALRQEVTEFKKLTETLVRASTTWATKEDLESKLKDMLTTEDRKALQRDLNSLRATLIAVGNTVGSLGKKVSELEVSDKQGTPNPNVEKCADGRVIDTHGYTKAPQIKELTDVNKAPLASVTFDAAKSKPWNYSVYERQFHLTTALSKQESGKFVFHHTLNYSVPEKSDQKYSIKLTSSDYLQTPETRRVFWWNPVLDVGAFVGGNLHSFGVGPGRGSVFSFGAELGISFSSYGKTKVDSLLRFFRVGAGYDAERQAGHLSFSPVSFNAGDPLPLITNLWFYPYAGVDSGGGVLVGGGIGFQL